MGAKAQSNAQIWRGETRQRHNGALARSLGAVDRVTKVEQWRVGAAEIERDGRHGDHQGVTVAGGGRKKWEVAPVGSHGETTVGLNDEEVMGDVTSTQDGSSISRHNRHDWWIRW
uniref:DUF834 domain-containing protein n=1 Tax=Oryza nivara TaxID=4536 RepID=A0A0E0G7R5_ORYNI